MPPAIRSPRLPCIAAMEPHSPVLYFAFAIDHVHRHATLHATYNLVAERRIFAMQRQESEPCHECKRDGSALVSRTLCLPGLAACAQNQTPPYGHHCAPICAHSRHIIVLPPASSSQWHHQTLWHGVNLREPRGCSDTAPGATPTLFCRAPSQRKSHHHNRQITRSTHAGRCEASVALASGYLSPRHRKSSQMNGAADDGCPTWAPTWVARGGHCTPRLPRRS